MQGMSGNLLLPRDLSWALGEIVNAPQERRAIWAEAIRILARPDTVLPCWDLFLERLEIVPELKPKFSWLRAWALDEPEALKAKENWLEGQRQELLAKRHDGLDPKFFFNPISLTLRQEKPTAGLISVFIFHEDKRKHII